MRALRDAYFGLLDEWRAEAAGPRDGPSRFEAAELLHTAGRALLSTFGLPTLGENRTQRNDREPVDEWRADLREMVRGRLPGVPTPNGKRAKLLLDDEFEANRRYGLGDIAEPCVADLAALARTATVLGGVLLLAAEPWRRNARRRQKRGAKIQWPEANFLLAVSAVHVGGVALNPEQIALFWIAADAGRPPGTARREDADEYSLAHVKEAITKRLDRTRAALHLVTKRTEQMTKRKRARQRTAP